MLFAFPGLDQEKGDGACGVNCEACYAGIYASVALLPTMGIASMRPKCANALGNRGQPAEHLANIGFDLSGKSIRPGESPNSAPPELDR